MAEPVLVFGAEVDALPEGAVAVEVLTFIKALDEEGESCWYIRHSAGWSDYEKLGVLTAEAARLTEDMVRRYQGDDDED